MSASLSCSSTSHDTMSIQPLPQSVIAQIRSSTTITSLNGVVLELVKNSFDAGSTKVDISVNYCRGGCEVEDDGLGILPSEFGENGGLGKLYHSSKLNTQNPVHGGRGTFLASLSAVCLLYITSHHHLYRSHNSLSMHNSDVISRQVPASAHQYLSYFKHGTRVTVRNLFGNMPVRVKQRAITAERHGGVNKEWDSLKRDVVTLLLAWPSGVTVNLREAMTNQKMVIRIPSRFGIMNGELEMSRTCNILSQASFMTPEAKAAWVSVGASTPTLEICGTISLEPSATKHVQFMSFDIQPLLAIDGNSILHDAINRLFFNSAFGNEEEVEKLDDTERERRSIDARYKGSGYTNKELKGGKKGVDRWPMFYINIRQISPSETYKNFEVDDILDDKRNSLGTIIELLQAMVTEFLIQHHFRPKAPRVGQAKRTIKDAQGDPEISMFTEGDALFGQQTRKTVLFAESTKSTSSRGSNLGRERPNRIRNTNSDLLGANVKLPLFRRQSGASESPFDAWSRIKSGTAKPASDKVEPSAGQASQRSSTAPPLIFPTAVNTIETTKPLRSLTPLISSSGTVIRRPFDDIPEDSSQPKLESLQLSHRDTPHHSLRQKSTPNSSIHSTQNKEPIGDEIVSWINPITKTESIINKRTGHTLPATNSESSFSFTHQFPSTSCHFPLLPNLAISPSEPAPWLSDVLKNWNNPIFLPTEQTIPRASLDGPTLDSNHRNVLHDCQHLCSQVDIDWLFKEYSAGVSGRISKAALKNAEVIAQVDNKFILVKVSLSSGVAVANSASSIGKGRGEEKGTTLVVIDQHAADERIRVEDLTKELCTPPSSSALTESGVATISLEKPLAFDIALKETDLLKIQRSHFAGWGILYDLPTSSSNAKQNRIDTTLTQRLLVHSLPPSIAERCKLDPKLLIDLIRTEAWRMDLSPSSHTTRNWPSNHQSISPKKEDNSWVTKIHNCPPGILDMLNSRACRSAIMFNDVLTRDQCKTLVRRLANCSFPFMCAHGRPSLIPLVELGSVPGVSRTERRFDAADGKGFGKSFTGWKRSLKGCE